jgi:hypothetical protein
MIRKSLYFFQHIMDTKISMLKISLNTRDFSPRKVASSRRALRHVSCRQSRTFELQVISDWCAWRCESQLFPWECGVRFELFTIHWTPTTSQGTIKFGRVRHTNFYKVFFFDVDLRLSLRWVWGNIGEARMQRKHVTIWTLISSKVIIVK